MFLAGNLLLSERSYTLVGRNTVTGQSEPISVTEGCPINLPFDPLHINTIKRRKIICVYIICDHMCEIYV